MAIVPRGHCCRDAVRSVGTELVELLELVQLAHSLADSSFFGTWPRGDTSINVETEGWSRRGEWGRGQLVGFVVRRASWFRARQGSLRPGQMSGQLFKKPAQSGGWTWLLVAAHLVRYIVSRAVFLFQFERNQTRVIFVGVDLERGKFGTGQGSELFLLLGRYSAQVLLETMSEGFNENKRLTLLWISVLCISSSISFNCWVSPFRRDSAGPESCRFRRLIFWHVECRRWARRVIFWCDSEAILSCFFLYVSPIFTFSSYDAVLGDKPSTNYFPENRWSDK